MRQRTTFFHGPEHAVEPASLAVAGRSLSGPDLEAVREDRLTVGLDVLPAELQELLRRSPELHIRWASPRPCDLIGPWASRLPPGLHVFYTPQTDSELPSQQFCPILQAAFGPLDCSSPEKAFTKLPGNRFSQSAAYQYYQPLDSLGALISYAQQSVCAPADGHCRAEIQRLGSAASLDFSFDAVSHVAKITALWPAERQPLMMTSPPQQRLEVGILMADYPQHLKAHELGVTGLLTVLGEDSKPAPTMFAFPARHKHAGSSFSAAFLSPTGLHPRLQLRLGSAKPPLDDASCSPHAYLTLPRTVFADKYQLDDALFLDSKNLTSLRYTSQPVDLEAPEYALKLWGSGVLLELQTPPDRLGEGSWTAEIPLHLRYLAPAAGGYRSVQVPYPAVFWACAAEEGTKFPNSPFERANLGYDGLFGPRTMFWHVDPKPEDGGRLTNMIRVPVLDLDKSGWVGAGTAAVVLLGLGWVVYKLLDVYLRTGYGPHRAGGEQQRKKKQ